MTFSTEHPQFFTATIYEWKHLLKPDKYKKVILDSLSFLARNERVFVYGFVIMNNHLHLIWQIRNGFQKKDMQRDFLKFTAQQIKFDLEKHHPKVLKHFYVNLKDRKYQFWQRNPLSVDLYSPSVFEQKLDYIHENPVKAGLCKYPEDYYFSSARFYSVGDSSFSFLSHQEG